MRAALALSILFAAFSLAAAPPGAIQRWPDGLAWLPGSAVMPRGAQMAVLEGNPKAEGLFTIRLKLPANSRIAPHWHPRDERVTVLSGTVVVGFGDSIEESALARFGAGSFT